MTSILIVEDETNVRDTLALNLRAEGYEVTTAADGEAGWAAARETQFDLIVLDELLRPRIKHSTPVSTRLPNVPECTELRGL